MGSNQDAVEHETPICIVGGGPVGMLTAFELSRLGVDCLLAEMNLETTKWPKMDLTNCRSMEILRMMGIADELRAQKGALSGEQRYDSIFYTSCSEGGKVLTKWPLGSADEWRSEIEMQNDGSSPAEPGQRCSQIVIEAWLKRKCLAQHSINGKWGWKYLSHEETPDEVKSCFVNTDNRLHLVRSKYLVGADGGSSRVRKHAGIEMQGGPLPFAMFLVHFRSQELLANPPYGKFWHMFPPTPGFIIDQDDAGTFTAHLAMDSIDQDISKIDPREWVYKIFGGAGEPYRFKIDEIYVTSGWRPNFSLAKHYLSSGGRVLLGGDAAHWNPPHGGYGMNSGVEDALAMAWRLSAVTKGYGGQHLLSSYEDEQRQTMIQRLERCNRHIGEHVPRYTSLAINGPELIMAETAAGEAMRKEITDFLDLSGSECLDRGIELDARYKSAAIFQDGKKEPAWELKRYMPSTYPGSRAPHVFLKDGKTSILDTYGPEWSFIAFVDGEETSTWWAVDDAELFGEIAAEMGMPLKQVILRDEKHAHAIWGYNLVLVRADGHVAWRGQKAPDREGVKDILMVVTGHKRFHGYVAPAWRTAHIEGLAAQEGKLSAEDFLGVGDQAGQISVSARVETNVS